MAEGDFDLSVISTVITLIETLFSVSAESFKQQAVANAKYFAYDGFNATMILEAFFAIFKKNDDSDEALQELCDIVNIGLTRGNIRKDQLQKTSKHGKERITFLSEKYKIPMKANKAGKVDISNETLTFTRSLSVFPFVASQIIASGVTIPESLSCPFGSDKLPTCMRHSGFASLIPYGNKACEIMLTSYVAFMMSFAKKINPNQKLDNKALYNRQMQFTKAAWNNFSVYSAKSRVEACKKLNLNSLKYAKLYLKISNNMLKEIGEQEFEEKDVTALTTGNLVSYG